MNLKLQFEKRSLLEGETPESFFEKLKGESLFLVQNGQKYYLGNDPFLLVWSENGVLYVKKKRDFGRFKKDTRKQIVDSEDLQFLKEIFKEFQVRGCDEFPLPFFGGAVGFFSYDFGCRLMQVKQQVFDDLNFPDFHFGFYDKVIAFDYNVGEIYLCAVGETDLVAKGKIGQIKEDLKKPARLSSKGEIGQIESNLSKKVYLQKIEQIKELIRAGETYQVNFSQRFSADCTLDPWSIYKKLGEINPAPFGCFFENEDFSIVSASPELLVRKKGRDTETWPIKGTVKRAAARNLKLKIKNYELWVDGARLPDGGVATDCEDVEAIAQLLASEKDRAELNMIVDLSRNDLGKVCESGSVRVLAEREIQILSNVIHTFSRIGGKLSSNKDVFDIINALFPGGSITGCPKKRTMEIIDKMEDFRRGVYTGSAGWIGFNGDAEFNIMIRTMLFKDSRLYFQAGGGIVADSDPAKEYEETLNKIESLKRSILK